MSLILDNKDPEMMTLPYLLFCEHPLEAGKVDPDYEAEFDNAKQHGFKILFIHFETLISDDINIYATRKIAFSQQPQIVIYRGWMLTPKQYGKLYTELKNKNYQLINTPEQYQNCHYLPDSLKYIEAWTPQTVYQKLEDENSMFKLIHKASIFGSQPVILKDYVKSEKHDWETACYVKDASQTDKLLQSIQNLIRIRGKYLNEGIVIRAFVELNYLTTHSKSGMPLTEEYRLFFYNKKLIAIYNYWDEGTYLSEKPDTMMFEAIALTIDSNFFSMDIARQQNNVLLIIELGDAQVTGLPDNANRYYFYEHLKKCAD